jgi:hypothetical protein
MPLVRNAGYAFVSDVASTRVVKVKLNYAAEEICPIQKGEDQ